MSEYNVRYADIRVDDITGRLIRNPAYGGPRVGLNGWCYSTQVSSAFKPKFFEALSESIREDGVRNPILVWSLPEGIFLTFGGSRVRAARAIGLQEVPAIINDYTGDYSGAAEVTPENVHTFFTDPPRDFEFGEFGFDYHYNLERARRFDHDPNGFAWVEGHPDFIDQEFPWISSSMKSKQS